MSIEWVPVSENERGEPIELPTEEDGALLLSTVAAQFPRCSGLKYRAAGAGGGGRLRGLRLHDARLQPPPEGWAAHRYWCAFPRERTPSAPSPSPSPSARCSDLIVLGLPWKTGEEAVREYFAAFGELAMVQVKRDADTGLSKGFGFVKFAEVEAQARALGRRHLIDGRWCDVRVPHGRGGDGAGGAPSPALRKVFVGRCTEALTAEDLRDHFAAYGRVTDVFVPRPFRAFGFVTFLEAEVAQSLCGQDHIIKGVSVNVSTASPKRERVGGGGSLLGWGLVEGARVLGWPPPPGADAYAHPHPHPHPHHHLADKPYLEYE